VRALSLVVGALQEEEVIKLLTDERGDGGEDGEVDELERDPGDPVDDVVDAERAAEGVDEVAEEHGHERHRGAVGDGAERAQHHEHHVRAVREREQPVERHPGRRRRGIRVGVPPRVRHGPRSRLQSPAHRDSAPPVGARTAVRRCCSSYGWLMMIPT
jgi:hypothetical protein